MPKNVRKRKYEEKLNELALMTELSYWTTNSRLTLDSMPFTFKDHEYLIDLYQDDARKKVVKKAAQLGYSTYEILSAVFDCKNKFPKGILYMFPTKDDVSDFSRARLTRLISENNDTVGKWISSTDQVNIKQIGTSYLYLRGARTRTALKSIPVDKIVFDEYDEMRPGVGTLSSDRAVRFDPIALARERYSHSDYQEEDMLSTPTLPDYGIEGEYAKSDQKYWFILCKRCNAYTCLELTFPDCLKPDKNGKVRRVCKKCGRTINPSNGQWVAKEPDNEVSGYYISQLCSKKINPQIIYDTWVNLDTLTSFQRTEFYNSKLGMGYVEIQDRLSRQQIFGLCDSYPLLGIERGDRAECCMGIDQGKDLHVVVGKRISEKAHRVVHIGIYKEWEDLYPVMQAFNVWRCVVDAQPEMRNARKFAEQFPGRVFLNFYQSSIKGKPQFNYMDLNVKENRTESLDNSHKLITEERVILPRRGEELETFTAHCTNIAKKLIENEESGSKVYEYVKLGPDHYRHALNYYYIAAEDGPIVGMEVGERLESFRGFRPMVGKEERLCDTYH